MKTEEFDLFYSENAMLTKVLFIANNKTLTIFVEDINKEYEYEEIFEQLYSDKLSISCIFPTGGKPFLKEAYELFGENPDFGKCFFIADGDFDKTLGISMINKDNFLYLTKYNIESYYFSKKSAINFIRPKIKKEKKITEKIIEYDTWEQCIDPFLKKIFTLHCVVQRYKPELKNVSRSPHQFINQNGEPDLSGFEEYKLEVKREIPYINLEEEMTDMQDLLEKDYGSDFCSYVCGKYCLHSLTQWLKSKTNKNIKTDDLKEALIRNLEIKELEFLINKMNAYLLN